MESHDQLAANIVEHCCGKGNPTGELIARGAFPKNWVSRYRALLEKVSHVWRDRAEWPREVVAAIHFSSLYLEVRYLAWKASTGNENRKTLHDLGAVRQVSEAFLMSPIFENLGSAAEEE